MVHSQCCFYKFILTQKHLDVMVRVSSNLIRILDSKMEKEEHGGSLMDWEGTWPEYIPKRDVISNGPSMGITGERDSGWRRVTWETNPLPLNTVMLTWRRRAYLTSAPIIFLPVGISMQTISICVFVSSLILIGGLGLLLDPKGLPLRFLVEARAGDGISTIGVSLVVVVVWETIFALMAPIMTEELPECVENLTGLLTKDSFLELGEKNEGGGFVVCHY